MINFYPLIRKLKIDKLLERPASNKNNTKYLSLLDDKKPEEIDQVEDLFLADLLF